MDIIGFLPSFGGVLWTLLAFVAALSIIVAVHEFGHYIVGRWCGIHAEVFSLGMGPALIQRTDKRGTVWQVAALPLGGYVKFLGDADAASGQDADAMAQMDSDTRTRSMHGAAVWRRSLTVAAGPVFNFALSILVFGAVILWQGQATDQPTIGKIQPLPVGASALQPGDVLTAINGQDVTDYASLDELRDTLPDAPQQTYTILRDGTRIDVVGPHLMPPLAAQIQPRSAAFDAGLQKGDVITAIDGTPVHAFDTLRDIVGASDGRALALTVWRGGEILDITLSPRRMDLPLADGGFETRWLIGVSGGLFFEPATQAVGPLTALGQGASQMVFIIQSSLSGMWHMITGAISTCNLSGPIGIAETSGAVASQGLVDFIWFIAVLSTAVGLLNLFPIPVLDGGHLVFHAWEAITGHPPGERVMNAMMTGGLILILTLMVFAVTNDLFCP